MHENFATKQSCCFKRGTFCMGVCRICYCGVLNKNSVQVERSERSVLTAWGPGARSRAPGGVQGQRPGGGPGGRAPGSSWVFKTPKRLSSHSFSFIFKTSFSAKSFDIVRYKMILGLIIKAHSLCLDIGSFIGIQRRGDLLARTGGVWGGCAPPWEARFFFVVVLFCF